MQRLTERQAPLVILLDTAFDAVVCTLSLCNIPDTVQAVSEMNRVFSGSNDCSISLL